MIAVMSVSATPGYKIHSKALRPTAVATQGTTKSIKPYKPVTCFFDGSVYDTMGDYYVVVSDTETASYDQNLGEYSATNGWIISLDFVHKVVNPIALLPGTYQVIEDTGSSDPAEFSVISDYSSCLFFDTNGELSISATITGEVIVTAEEDDIFSITAKAIDDSGNTYDITYSGRLPFTDPSHKFSILRQIMEDRTNETFIGGLGFYYGTSLQTSKGGEIMIQLYSADYGTEDGRQYDETTMICLDLVGRPFPNGNIEIDPGTYPIVPITEAARGKALSGREISYMSQTMGIGTYLRDRSSSKYDGSDPYAYAYLASGDIVIEKSDKGYKITLENGVTDLGYKVAFTYDGPIGPLHNYAPNEGNNYLSTITDDVNLKIDDIQVARSYYSGVVNGSRTFLLSIGSHSHKYPERTNGGDAMTLEFCNDLSSQIIAPGVYDMMEEKWETYYEPGKLVQSRWIDSAPSGTCYVYFEEGRYLVMKDYAWFLKGRVTVTKPNGDSEELNNQVYSFDIDLISDNGFFVKGQWTGPVQLMYDAGAFAEIEAVKADGSNASVRALGNGTYQIVDYAGEVAVYNVTGTLCLTASANDPIDLSSFPGGVYIFKMGQTSIKIIK